VDGRRRRASSENSEGFDDGWGELLGESSARRLVG